VITAFVNHLRSTECAILRGNAETDPDTLPPRYEAAFKALPAAAVASDVLKSLEFLVIDEVYLLPTYIFTLADVILRGNKNKFSAGFGGVPCLLSGDPLQGYAIADEHICLDAAGQSGKAEGHGPCLPTPSHVPPLSHLQRTH
jgi:hypothetical protein